MPVSPDVNTDGPVGVEIKLNNKPMADTIMLKSARTSHAVNRIPEATFTVLSNSPQVEDFDALDSSDFALGTKVEISAFYGSGDAQRLFKGIILSTRVRMTGSLGIALELTCRDPAMALTEIRRSEPYEEMTDSDAMTRIITVAGLQADIEATTNTMPLNLRIGATDWDFLRLLADRNGCLLTVADGTITAAPPNTDAAPPLVVSYGIDIIELDVAIEAQRMVAGAKTSAWSEKEQELVSGDDAQLPTEGLGDTKISDIAKVLGNRVAVAATTRDLASADLTALSRARLGRAALGSLRGTVKFQGSGAIHPMDMLEIADCGARFSGNGLVSEVEHMIDAGTWTTQTRLGVPQDWTSDTFGLAAPAAEAFSTPVQGLQIGKVVTVAEDPENRQRIQVTLPMIGDPAAVVWARFASPYASSEAGFQFLPEVGDEVLVSFLNADPNAPVIIGSLHSDKARRPEQETVENFVKTIVTREDLSLSFDDENKVITVKTPGGHILTLDDEASAFTMEDMGGNKIVMNSSGITLTSDKDITLKAGGSASVEATQDATVSAVNVTCDASTNFTGKGGATAEVSSGGQTKVEGSMVMIN